MNPTPEETGEHASVTQVENISQTHPDARIGRSFPQKTAFLHERLVAFLIDLFFLGSVLGGAYYGYFHFIRKKILAPWELDPMPQWILIGTALIVIFIYHLVFEGVWATTLGKGLCRLKVFGGNDRFPSFFAIILRNLFRFIDLLLFPLALFLMMEGSQYHRRLGDVISGTKVARKIDDPSKQIPAHEIRYATANRRGFAFLIDLILVGLLCLGALLMIPTDQEPFSTILIYALSLAPILYWLSFELWGGGSPGKLILGMKILDEDGYPPRLPAILVRTILRFTDLPFIGYLTIFFSKRKQRLGDLVSLTVISRHPLTLFRILCFVLILASGLFLLNLGLQNPKSYFHSKQFIDLKVLPVPENWSQWLPVFMKPKLAIKHIVLQSENQQIPEQPIFFPGNIIAMHAEVIGTQVRENEAWLQVDLVLNDAQGETIWERLNIIDKGFPSAPGKPIHLKASFLIPQEAKPGDHTLTVTIRDRYGKNQSEKITPLTIKPAAMPPLAPLLPAPTPLSPTP